MERRLAAILAADIAGYSRLMGEDEERTVRALQELQAAIFPVIGEHGGRVINTAGDSVLVEFASVVEAVRCAAAVQQLIADRNAEVPASQRLQFRVGVNQGEIVADRDEVYGEGINVAARLESLAEPGGIAISGRVYEDVAGKVDMTWQDAGEQPLKNIARPIRVWRWSVAGVSERPTLPLPDRPSIAVLAFDNLSGQAEDAIFSDGITEDIITGLARFRSLFVVARNSSFSFSRQDCQPERNRQAARRVLPSRGKRPAGRRPHSHHGTAHRGGEWRSRVSGLLRPQPDRDIRSSGRADDHHRVDARRTDRGRKAQAIAAQADGEPRGL
ncbi:adenylate/guanylate cyclase domain-containing protein [Mesorhizobium sp.]|uniref:adenylate/guanylate cyclase domain-containing protein n=1 Tax=Mesorhizobium sp. TaxID=1871066 RepID=UPI0025BE837F|nr:adenylate/guanylate cyclase domain-containing protein [Mesorhizobium sp.]